MLQYTIFCVRVIIIRLLEYTASPQMKQNNNGMENIRLLKFHKYSL